MTLEEFNSKYVYKTDKKKFGFIEVWEIPELQDEKYYGDCESYCLFLKKNVPEFKDWKYYFCKLDGIRGHCVLSNGITLIDCNEKKIILTDVFIKKYKATDLKKYGYFSIISKIFIAKILLLFNNKK